MLWRTKSGMRRCRTIRYASASPVEPAAFRGERPSSRRSGLNSSSRKGRSLATVERANGPAPRAAVNGVVTVRGERLFAKAELLTQDACCTAWMRRVVRPVRGDRRAGLVAGPAVGSAIACNWIGSGFHKDRSNWLRLWRQAPAGSADEALALGRCAPSALHPAPDTTARRWVVGSRLDDNAGRSRFGESDDTRVGIAFLDHGAQDRVRPLARAGDQ